MKIFYCVCTNCVFVTKLFGVFLYCLAYFETQFGICCLCGFGNTKPNLGPNL